MNEDPRIKCPKCGAEIKLTESLAGPLVAATRREMQLSIDEAKAAKEEALQTIERRQRDLDSFVAEKVAQERRKADADAKTAVAVEVTALQADLAAAQKAQAEAVRKERELESRERAVTLTIEQGITTGVAQARQEALREAGEANRLALSEKDLQLDSMRRTIDDLKRKAEQGSQQLQGEVQELDLERQLREKFTIDVIGEVAKGVRGADITQTVFAPSGARCGMILWELKRTKNWSAGWLAKLREDGRAAQADILVIVSTALPEEVETFDFCENVWICSPKTALPVATALRTVLLAVHNTRQVQAGMRSKSEEVYAYVTGAQFRHRVEALVEAFTMLKDDLDAEKKAVTRQWAKREAQVARVMESTAGMFGDLQGIAGRALPEPDGLKALGGGE
jgi:hypothetical protein